ncbi:MAG: adenylosuccinate lyase [Bacilli bacterium]|nr:adenylosuccinate lyase [Bacilli bacterium]
MIQRYSRKEMSNIWSEENKFKTYLNVEVLATEAWMKLGVVPLSDYNKIKENAKFDLQGIYKLEETTKHDIVAFTRNVSESLGEEKKWIHYGLTSTDVIDTANGVLFKQANEILEKDLEEFQKVLKEKAIEFEKTPCIGRTHGIHADITSFGLKWALWYEEFNRHFERFKLARKYVECGKISGAVGNFANAPIFLQDYVCEQLGIDSSRISTQTLQRDRHAFYMSTLALVATSLEKIATEIRHLQRTEVREAEEPFSIGQKGSSAMPHKRNPITSENITGCARVIRGYMLTTYENVSLWHERDISHSSTERIIMPDATILLDYMLNRYAKTLKGLVVYKERMLENIFLTNKVIFAQRVMNLLISKNFSREASYDIVQKKAMQAYNEKIDFQKLLIETSEVMEKVTETELNDCFTLDYYLKNVLEIYKRIGIKE